VVEDVVGGAVWLRTTEEVTVVATLVLEVGVVVVAWLLPPHPASSRKAPSEPRKHMRRLTLSA
jgi:hypothetical protein